MLSCRATAIAFPVSMVCSGAKWNWTKLCCLMACFVAVVDTNPFSVLAIPSFPLRM
jgi:hypothetical protein